MTEDARGTGHPGRCKGRTFVREPRAGTNLRGAKWGRPKELAYADEEER